MWGGSSHTGSRNRHRISKENLAASGNGAENVKAMCELPSYNPGVPSDVETVLAMSLFSTHRQQKYRVSVTKSSEEGGP